MNAQRLIPVALFALGSSMVMGDEIEFDPPGMATSGDFHDEDNWVGGDVPGVDDRAYIPDGLTCNVVLDGQTTEFTVDSVRVEGTLAIAAGITLVLEDDENVGFCPACSPHDFHHHIDGKIDIGWSTGSPGILKFTDNDQKLVGDGEITGDGAASDPDDLAIIEIDAGIALTNQLADTGLTGHLSIKGLTGGTNGIFRNEGLVSPGDRGIIVLEGTTIIEDISGAEWEVVCTDSRIYFRRDHTDSDKLSGDFVHTGSGVFYFDEDITTCGTWVRNACGGVEFVNDNEVFRYHNHSSTINCVNPDATHSSSCSDPYTLDTDIAANCG